MATDAPVPPAVEEYLVGLSSSTGGLGGRAGGGAAGGKGGAAGGAAAARRMRTRVERRSGRATGVPGDVWRRLEEVVPGRIPLEREDSETGERFAVPVGRTGLQQIVVDLDAVAAGKGVDVTMTAYGKEGLLSRRPTRRTADDIWGTIAT